MLIWTTVIKDFVTDLIEPGPSSEANKSVGTQEVGGTQGSLLCSHGPATCPCPEPGESGLYAPNYLFKIQFNIIVRPTPRSCRWTVSLGFATKIL